MDADLGIVLGVGWQQICWSRFLLSAARAVLGQQLYQQLGIQHGALAVRVQDDKIPEDASCESFKVSIQKQSNACGMIVQGTKLLVWDRYACFQGKHESQGSPIHQCRLQVVMRLLVIGRS